MRWITLTYGRRPLFWWRLTCEIRRLSGFWRPIACALSDHHYFPDPDHTRWYCLRCRRFVPAPYRGATR